MIFVIDANILFSALIKDSNTAKLLFDENVNLFTPEFIFEEFIKYENFLLEKSSRKRENFIEIMHMLKEVITVIPKEKYSDFIIEAEKISPDQKDAMYFALALKLNCGVWSNDKKLKEQDKVKVYSTKEILNIVKK